MDRSLDHLPQQWIRTDQSRLARLFFSLSFRGRCYPHLFSSPGASTDLLVLLKITANWPWKFLQPLLKVLQELGTSSLPQYPNSYRNLEIYRVCWCTHFQRAKGRCFLPRALARSGAQHYWSLLSHRLYMSILKHIAFSLNHELSFHNCHLHCFSPFPTPLSCPCFFRSVPAQPAVKMLDIMSCCVSLSKSYLVLPVIWSARCSAAASFTPSLWWSVANCLR